MGKKDYDLVAVQKNLLSVAARLFLTIGYDKASVLKIADESKINSGSVVYAFKTKEGVVCELIRYILDEQFTRAEKMSQGKTDDKVLLYATTTVLQLYMAELNENTRKIYDVAYVLPNSLEIILHIFTQKTISFFQDSLPDWTEKNFYEREIASAGVIRNFMAIPCGIYFTMERKVNAFLESFLTLYYISAPKIREAIEFVSQFDFNTAAQQAFDEILAKIEADKKKCNQKNKNAQTANN